MDLSRVRPWEWIAGLAGAALLGVMFLTWYDRPGGAEGSNAWEAFAAIDLFLLVTALMGIALLVLTATQETAAVPIAVAALTALAATVALALVGFRLLVMPEGDVPVVGAAGMTRAAGVYLGLIATAGVAAGAWLAMRDEGFGLGSGTEPRPGEPIEARELPAPPPPGEPASEGPR